VSNEPTNNIETPDVEGKCSSFLPMLMLSLGFSLILLVQTMQAFQQHVALQRQIDSLASAIPQAENSQKILQAICMDLLKLQADGNADAKEIVQKNGINFNPPPAQPQ
jgi:hypothetical protein